MPQPTLEELTAWIDAYTDATDDTLADLVAAVLLAYEGVNVYSPAAVAAAASEAADKSNTATLIAAGIASQYVAATASAIAETPFPTPPPGLLLIRGGADMRDVYERPAKMVRRLAANDVPLDEAWRQAMTYLENIADGDIRLAQRKALNDSMKALGVTQYRRIVRPELAKSGQSCGLCITASDVIYNTSVLMPIHANCVPGDAKVRADNVLAVSRRHYAGPLVVLTTASGEQLRITANHPVLTDQGWVPAGLVNIGHEIVRDRLAHGVVDGRPHECDGPTTAEQVWRAATVNHGLDPRTVPLAPEDFHGDGGHGEVNVVSTDRLFASEGSVSFGKPLSQGLLVPTHGAWASLSGARGLFQSAFDSGFTSNGSIGSRSELGPLCRAHLALAQNGRRRTVTGGQVALIEPPINDVAGHPIAFRETQDRFTLPVSSSQIGGLLNSPTTRFDPAFAKFAGEGRGAYGQLGRNLRERLASDVELDCVVDKRWVEGPHVVYNLHTAEGWYSSDGLIVSNCNCTVMPIVGALDPGSSLNNLALGDLYDDAGGLKGEQLKKVRYEVNEHGEWGNVLTRAGDTFTGPQDLRPAA